MRRRKPTASQVAEPAIGGSERTRPTSAARRLTAGTLIPRGRVSSARLPRSEREPTPRLLIAEAAVVGRVLLDPASVPCRVAYRLQDVRRLREDRFFERGAVRDRHVQ